jgi:hypothetical protein
MTPAIFGRKMANDKSPKQTDINKILFHNGRIFLAIQQQKKKGFVNGDQLMSTRITSVAYTPGLVPVAVGIVDPSLCGSEAANGSPPPGGAPVAPKAPKPKKPELRVVK